MKKRLSLIFITLLLSSTVYGADTASGVFDATSPTYNRIFTSVIDPDCNATSTFSGSGVGVSYQVFEFYSPSGEVADLEVTGGLGDSVLSIYCDFDPANAAANLAAYDDDGAGNLLSAITPADNLVLEPNISYFAVVSTFSPGDFGTFDLVLGGDLVFGSPIPTVVPPAAPIPTLSEWGIIILSSLLMGLGILQRRRFFN